MSEYHVWVKKCKSTPREEEKKTRCREKNKFSIYTWKDEDVCKFLNKIGLFGLKYSNKKTFSSQIQSFCIKMFIFSPNIYLSSSSGIIFCLLLCFAGESCELLTTKRNTNKQKQLNGKFIWKTVIYNIHLKPKFFFPSNFVKLSMLNRPEHNQQSVQ